MWLERFVTLVVGVYRRITLSTYHFRDDSIEPDNFLLSEVEG
jgi:hypothetical protein